MDQAKEVFKSKNKQKPFNLEYWWEAMRQHQKWRSIYMEKDCSSKRAKISETGTYTSSSKETEETVEPRPEGQKQAKRKLKATSKGKSSSSNLQPDPTMRLYHDAMALKSEAKKEKACAMKDYAAATMEKARAKKLDTYMKMLQTNTSSFNEAKLLRHENIVDQLGLELFSIKD